MPHAGKDEVWQRPGIETKNVQALPTAPPVSRLEGYRLAVRKVICRVVGQKLWKSRFLAHGGVEKPTNRDAEFTVDGLDVIKGSLKQTVRRINYLFQNPSNQLFSQTFGEEVSFGPKALGLSPEEVEKRGRAVLRQVGLEKYCFYFSVDGHRDVAKPGLVMPWINVSYCR